jgi:hypothetical protein
VTRHAKPTAMSDQKAPPKRRLWWIVPGAALLAAVIALMVVTTGGDEPAEAAPAGWRVRSRPPQDPCLQRLLPRVGR